MPRSIAQSAKGVIAWSSLTRAARLRRSDAVHLPAEDANGADRSAGEPSLAVSRFLAFVMSGVSHLSTTLMSTS